MKVSNVGNAYEIYANKTTNLKKKESVGKAKDTVNVSDVGKGFQMAFKAVSNSPDIREDKVDSLKKQIDSGSYNISAEEISDKILSWLS